MKQARLVLGTAQLGMPYGAVNLSGMPREEEALTILRQAYAGAIRDFDTARAYGEAENRLGLAFESGDDVAIVTKLDPLADISLQAAPEVAVAAAARSLARSRRALRDRPIAALLLHRVEHLHAWNGAVWHFLQSEKAAGTIGRLGVSVQSLAETHRVLADKSVEHIQLPFNLLDHRWSESGVIAALRARPEMIVHVRSILLQGLLSGRAEMRWPRLPDVAPATIVDTLERNAAVLKRESIVDLCFAYVRAQDWIDGIVVGMETSKQVAENIALFARRPLSSAQLKTARSGLPHLPETLLDPARWPRAIGAQS
jgi:aryl-alcohol dehydrogenase-like predicted oxidoreductase